MTTQLEMGENNERAAVISEEIDFIDGLLSHEDLMPDVIRQLIDRRDQLRDAIKGLNFASPTDEPVEGIPLPDTSLPDEPSEEYDAEDDIVTLAEDEDHEFVQSRAPYSSCITCGEPYSEHPEE